MRRIIQVNGTEFCREKENKSQRFFNKEINRYYIWWFYSFYNLTYWIFFYHSKLKQYYCFLFGRERDITFLSWNHHPKLSFFSRVSITDITFYFDLKGIYDTADSTSTNIVDIFWKRLIKEEVHIRTDIFIASVSDFDMYSFLNPIERWVILFYIS